MKRRLAFALAVLVLLTLSGCSRQAEAPVRFYYLNKNSQSTMDALIASEEREASGHRENLAYLLSFYLLGPVSEELSSPLPTSVLILGVSRSGQELHISLSDTSAFLTDYEFSLACACLSLTCMGLTDAEAVTITSGGRTLTMNPDNLALTDNTIPEESSK